MDGHAAIAAMWAARKFEPSIRHIRFPYFRNLEPGLRIDFNHPITALVGPNGTNKSSILRAIQGCPEGQNIGRFWFGTPLDSIPPSERHRFVYGRWSASAKEVVEIVQIRRARKRPTSADPSPDYFETNEPLILDGMSKMPPATKPLAADRTTTRWKSIEKEVAYFDFRAEISAFDKFFYHNDSNIHGRSLIKYDEQIRSRKEILADKSKFVKRILEGRLHSFRPGGKELVVEPPRSLTKDELDAVSFILGRTYGNIDIVHHRAFRATGVTAQILTEHFGYTEAWAGSGEFAVIRLVSLISNCSDNSLLLLDEPEVSLHPGAQSRLVRFLVEIAKRRRLQIVIATHSPIIVNSLPPEAIKVLDRRSHDGKVVLRAQKSYPAEAFVALEHDTKRKTIFVEDRLAREIVLHVLRLDGELRLNAVDVKVQPGGWSTLLARSLPQWALEKREDVLILLDGDQATDPPPPSDTIADSQLREAAKKVLRASPNNIPANTGGPTQEALKTIIDFGRRRVRFLPGREPDAWLAQIIEPTASDIGDGKDWWNTHAKALMGRLESESVTSDEQFFHQAQAIVQIPKEHPDLQKIRSIVEEFLND
ncbi:AAA family ATPase [Nocardia abscessus]|uniref:ATP-dependent nuclease n=1 Tax=Nocardia abscessus TaxID=120957 RepID=UPI0018956CDF|nr:AAA family ATPase [Nocardia abscessus]MBF6218042.1 AAA family ATPase [Nocardia abscessus]